MSQLPRFLPALLYGLAAVLLLAGTLALAQVLLARLWPAEGEEEAVSAPRAQAAAAATGGAEGEGRRK